MNLIRACIKGDLVAVKKFLQDGVDVNSMDSSGRTALIEAAWSGNSEIVKLLLNSGADIDASDKSGFTALMRASEEGHTTVVGTLIAKGADVNIAGKVRGTTPLMLAAENGCLKIIQVLLDGGAKINAVDQYEETALARAYRTNQIKAATLLESKGARGKTERSIYSQPDKEFRPISKAALSQWSPAAIESDEDEIIDDREEFLE